MQSGRGGFRQGSGAPIKPDEDKIKSKQIRLEESVLELVEQACASIYQQSGKKVTVRTWIEDLIKNHLSQ